MPMDIQIHCIYVRMYTTHITCVCIYVCVCGCVYIYIFIYTWNSEISNEVDI